MNPFYKESTARNIGIISFNDHQRIKDASVSIAGLGGVGGLLAERLVRIGVGRLKISDPGLFERSNFNRQFGAAVSSLDKNKAKVISDALIDINNDLDISFDDRGIYSQSNADELVSDTSVVIDAMDYPLIKESIYLQRAARKRGIYYLFGSALAYGALVVIFDPNGFTLEEYNGFQKDANLEHLNIPNIAFEKVCPELPSYIIKSCNLEMLKEMTEGKRPLSAICIGAGLSSIMLANEVISIILGRKPTIFAPHYLHIDLVDKSVTIK